jgi:hypothetical protein
MAGIGPATSPLPRECSTTEPHGHRHGPAHGGCAQAGDDTSGPAFEEPLPTLPMNQLERETGIEPVSLAWKAKVLPLNYSRLAERRLAGLLVGRCIWAASGLSPLICPGPLPAAARALRQRTH